MALLTDTLLTVIAQRANFYFDVDLRDGSDTYFLVGDGVDDLDHVITLMTQNERIKVRLDIGELTSDLQPVTLSQVQTLKADYIAYWGDVNKPPVTETFRPETAFPIPA